MEEPQPLLGAEIAKVLKDLGLYDETVPLYHYYYPLLGPNWSEEGEETGLNRLRTLADGLKESSDFIRRLIRDENWRPVVIGNAIAMLLRRTDFQADMIWRLRNWNWAAPQLAVGIAKLDKGNGEKALVKILESATEESVPKTVMSTWCSLRFIGSKSASEFQSTDIFQKLAEADRKWDDSERITESQWRFWNRVEPIDV
jgi:hypothetical protein